jgi:carboxyl-terminal processing protease
VAEAYETINAQSLERPPRQELVDGAMRGMMGVLNNRGDIHSVYIDPRRAAPFMDEMRQEFGGIGVHIRLLGDPSRLVLVGMPEPGSPAALAGIRANDQVLDIDGVPVDGMKQEEIIDRMRGGLGEAIVLTIRHEGEPESQEVRLVRDTINLSSVVGDRRYSDGSWRFLLDEDPRIAYVRLTSFGAKTVEELAETLLQVEALGARALVLDVRDNPGGALDAGVGVSELFLPKGAPIVEIRGRDGVVEDSYAASADGAFLDIPMVVLINENSASASEIVAAALQDHGRALVAGERTFGKGTVQGLFPVESGKSYLKLTTSSYWRPSGKNIHRLSDASPDQQWGVSPDPLLAVELGEDQSMLQMLWRNSRDLTVFDPKSGERVSRPEPLSSEQEVELDGYEDRTLLRAVEHLQAQLDAGA